MTGTSFDRRFDRWMEDPEFEAAYKQHRDRIDAIDALMRALDVAREQQVITKATLARRIQAGTSGGSHDLQPGDSRIHRIRPRGRHGSRAGVGDRRAAQAAGSSTASSLSPSTPPDDCPDQRSMLRGELARYSSPNWRTRLYSVLERPSRLACRGR